MMNGGFIVLHRQMKSWEWYKDGNTKNLFLHLLLSANFADTRYKGKLIKRGQLMTSLPSLATDTGLSIQQVRTALDHLKSTGEITDDANSQYRVITVVKYCEYQKATDEITGDQQASNRRFNRRSTDDSTDEQQHNNNNNNINNLNNITREQEISPSVGLGFDDFWEAYPKKVGKQDAVKAWKKVKPDSGLLETIMSSLKAWSGSEQWNKEDGQYIPYPATWLNKRRWEETPKAVRTVPVPEKPAPVRKAVPAQNYEQRDYSNVQDDFERKQTERILARLREMGGN